MPLPTSITAVILTATLAQVTRALPISQNHRFAVYTPYWHQGPRHYVPPDFYSSHKRLGCETEPCDERLNQLLSLPDESTSTNNIPLTKRTKTSYRTGWTMSGMPFSVLYMNPKPHMSVRSPISESLRSLPPNYENIEAPPPISDNQVDQDIPDIQAEALQARFTLDHPSPTILPTRKQYSIIPQLFVSYGWGPLGK
ncbi:uncharacterized protein LOC128987169 [Macrosteles quadrilineatus]|uniref:uncharacterized protein LOC128987169 n=1 Tax=Macrosteles quadrilineatus TaxID=74068 RepID=UPI0023E0DD28|nr:uncharacterized protein LOC128987169 [Macrosteles quadrilineatus]